MKILKLLEAETGPVLENFPEDIPVSEAKAEMLFCPVNFHDQIESLSWRGEKYAAFKRKVASLRPWYDLSVEKRKLKQ